MERFNVKDMGSKSFLETIASEISQGGQNLKTTRSESGENNVNNYSIYNLSEIMMGLPAFRSPQDFLHEVADFVTGVLEGFGSAESDTLAEMTGGGGAEGVRMPGEGGTVDIDGNFVPSDAIPPPPDTPSGGHMRLSWGGFRNGEIPTSSLTAVRDIHHSGQATHYFEPTAGKWFAKMREAAKRDGVDIRLTDSYRTRSGQEAARRRNCKNGVCRPATAQVGTSIHGWARAIDVASGGNDRRGWIQRNGNQFGWIWPDWARRRGTASWEPWHFEFWGEEYIARTSASPIVSSTAPSIGVDVI